MVGGFQVGPFQPAFQQDGAADASLRSAHKSLIVKLPTRVRRLARSIRSVRVK